MSKDNKNKVDDLTALRLMELAVGFCKNAGEQNLDDLIATYKKMVEAFCEKSVGVFENPDSGRAILRRPDSEGH
ncbi:MAG: hypothetical protein FVQ81_02015 [Candidatus Glassbacteria bacterium]|nr:hypothetical protein [Candidatus Glassbacteria bacterium]